MKRLLLVVCAAGVLALPAVAEARNCPSVPYGRDSITEVRANGVSCRQAAVLLTGLFDRWVMLDRPPRWYRGVRWSLVPVDGNVAIEGVGRGKRIVAFYEVF